MFLTTLTNCLTIALDFFHVDVLSSQLNNKFHERTTWIFVAVVVMLLLLYASLPPNMVLDKQKELNSIC